MTFIDFLIYGGIAVGIFIAGGLFAFFSSFIYDIYKNWKLKRNVPKTADGKLDYDKMESLPKAAIDVRRNEEDEKRKFEKFREFEKLRSSTIRNANDKSRPNATNADREYLFERDVEDARLNSIQNEYDTGAGADKRNNKKRIRINL